MDNEQKLAKVRSAQLQAKMDLSLLYKKIFNTPEGQVVLEDIADMCYLVRPTHQDGDQPLDLARKEGMRQAVCLIMQKIELNTFDILDVIKETNKTIGKKREQIDFINTSDDVLDGGSDV